MAHAAPRPPREYEAMVTPAHNVPLYALGTTGFLVVVMLVLILTGRAGEGGAELFVGLILSTLPSLIAAVFSERVARDVRNGVVAEQTRVGTVKALDQTGVIDAVEQGQGGATTAAALEALAELLEQSRESGAEREARKAREAAQDARDQEAALKRKARGT